MPYEPRGDRLLRDELLLYQRRALRTWCASDWLAEHDPVAWKACDTADPGVVRVSLGYAEPGCIMVGDEDTADLSWSAEHGLPFEDGTVDALYAHGSAIDTKRPKHLARVLRTGGTVTVKPPMGSAVAAAMVAHGFAEDDLTADGRRQFTLTQGKTSLADAAPLTVDEHVMGDRKIREPRTPYRR